MASDQHGDGADREPRDGESWDGAGHVRPVPPGVPNAPEDDAVGRLKVTSPRLENDEIALTPVGRREVLGVGGSSGQTEQRTSSSRAVHDPTVGLDDSEQATLSGGESDGAE